MAADDTQHLLETLGDLHRQLAAIRNVDPEARARLVEVLNDIQAVLDRETASMPQKAVTEEAVSGSVAGRLTEAARHFEEDHPTLAGTLANLVDALSRMGI